MKHANSRTVDFALRRFGICQSSTAMKVGTDAIVLGAWVARLATEPGRILDVGTGTGILTLMLAQRYPLAKILAIDIESDAIHDATGNVAASPYADTIEVRLSSFVQLQADHRGACYDLIISNPPYHDTLALISPEAKRRLARSESVDGLGLGELISGAKHLLSTEGRLCFICPTERIGDVRRHLTEQLYYIEHLCLVYSSERSPIRYLVAARHLHLGDSYRPTRHSTLCLRTEEGTQTDEYRGLTAEYLLQ